MITVDVCWWDGGGDNRRIIGVEMQSLPRCHDELNLEGLSDEQLSPGFDADEEPYDVQCLIVQRVVFRAQPAVIDSIVQGKQCSLIEVWTSAPGDLVCHHCGKAV